jgi:hypothetical protein
MIMELTPDVMDSLEFHLKAAEKKIVDAPIRNTKRHASFENLQPVLQIGYLRVLSFPSEVAPPP